MDTFSNWLLPKTKYTESIVYHEQPEKDHSDPAPEPRQSKGLKEPQDQREKWHADKGGENQAFG